MNDIKAIVKKSGTSFFWSMRMLPKAKREAMYTIYAFCRHIDDIVDGDSDMSEKQELLQAWREELDNIYDKKVPATEIGRRIYKNCMRFKLPKEEFMKLIDSISMDIPQPLQAPSLTNFMPTAAGLPEFPEIYRCVFSAVPMRKLSTTWPPRWAMRYRLPIFCAT